MADNLSQKVGKSSEKTKYSNAVNRTTSETMRLGEPEKEANHPTTLISTPNQRKKTPSFQITSVTVGSRTSNDGGDDSADDLDESHTDDMSDVIDNSRVTDIENETPSYSEDTFSKEDVFFNSSTSLGTAPVIPTSSQYGLAIVASEGGGNIINAPVACANTISGGEVHVGVTDAGNVINLVGSVKPHETEMRDVHAHHAGRNERFKVVKIESTEPFKRGRWLCMDYLDHTVLQQQAVINVVRSSDSGDSTTAGSVQYVGPDSGVVLTDGLMTLQSVDDSIISIDQPQLKPSAVTLQDQQALVAAQHQVTMTGLASGQNATGPSNYPSVSPGQTLQQVQQPGPVQPTQQHVSITSQAHQGLQQQPPPVQQAMPQSLPQSMQQVVSQQVQQQNQPANQQPSHGISTAQVLQQQQHHTQSMSQVPVQQNIAAGVPQQPQPVAQHQSLPPQQIQQVMAAANLQQLQQQQQNLMPQQTQQPFAPQQNPQLQQASQQQNVIQQQVSTQPVPQGMVSAQQPQSQQQHIITQPGQAQGQYYNIPSSTQVGTIPISQGQSGIQLVSQQPHTSITAQTQTIQTSAANQLPSGITTSQSQQPQTVSSISLQTVAHHPIQPVPSQNPTMQPIVQPSMSQQLPSQTSQQQNIQQQIQQHQQYAQQPLQQMQPQSQQVVQQPQQTVPQQTVQQPQQTVPQQAIQPPQPTILQQGIPQVVQQPQQGMPQQAVPQQAMQVMQQPQQGMPQSSMQQPQQVMQQPQPAMSQVMQQPQQAVPQAQQTIPQVIQQSQKSMPQQVMQQQPPQTLQPPQQAMQPQVMPQPPQAMQQQMHHSANLQNVQQQQQQIHVGTAPGIVQQPAPTSIPAMVQGQGMMPASQGQNLITGHQMVVAGGQQVPQQAPQMVPASSSAVSSIPGTSQTFSHMPVSQAPVQTFATLGTTTVSSRTVPSCVGTSTVSVGLDGIVEQGAGLVAASTVGGDSSVALLESLVEVTASTEEVQPGGVTTGDDAER